MGLLDKITSIGTLALVGIAGYLVWANWETIRQSFCSIPGADIALPSVCTAEDKTICPAGTWENKDHTCCPTGSVYEGGVCKDVNMPVCPPGTLWRNGQCVPYDVDIPGTCKLPEKWDAILKRCINPNQPGMIVCPDGSEHYPGFCPTTTPAACGKYTGMCKQAFDNVRSWIDNRQKDSLCHNTQDPDLHTWIAEFMPYDYAEVVKICQGAYDKPVTDLRKCPDGTWVDLNNPPGTTMEKACTYVNPGACKKNLWDAMIGCGQTLPGKRFCCGNEITCNALGADIDLGGGCYANEAQVNYYNCLKMACGW